MFEDNDTASSVLKNGIEKANKAYENGGICSYVSLAYFLDSTTSQASM